MIEGLEGIPYGAAFITIIYLFCLLLSSYFIRNFIGEYCVSAVCKDMLFYKEHFFPIHFTLDEGF